MLVLWCFHGIIHTFKIKTSKEVERKEQDMTTERKCYKTIDEQIDYLVENKKIKRDTIDKKLLLNKSYLSAINPYTELICIGKENGKHIYPDAVDFEQYKFLNNLDDKLCTIFRNYISCFEKKLKTFVADKISNYMSNTLRDRSCCNYIFFEEYQNGNTPTIFIPYLKMYDEYGNLVDAIEPVTTARKNAITEINDINNDPNPKYKIIQHYKNKGYVPFWVMIHALSLSKLVALYNMFIIDIKKEFLKIIYNKDITSTSVHSKFTYKLYSLINIRNIVNHYEPIIPFFIHYEYKYLSTLIELIPILKSNYPYNSNFIPLNKIYFSKKMKYQKSTFNIYKINKVIEAINAR